MTTSTLTLAAFLNARLEEDEAAALAAQSLAPFDEWDAAGVMADDELQPGALSLAQGSGSIVGLKLSVAGKHALPTVAHIARHDPARVLAEVAAKRGVIEQVWQYEYEIDGEWGYSRSVEELQAAGVEPVALRHLAAVYSDHPDYDERWRP